MDRINILKGVAIVLSQGGWPISIERNQASIRRISGNIKYFYLPKILIIIAEKITYSQKIIFVASASAGR